VVAGIVLRWVDREYRRRRLGGMALYDWRAFGGGFHPGGGEVVRRGTKHRRTSLISHFIKPSDRCLKGGVPAGPTVRAHTPTPPPPPP